MSNTITYKDYEKKLKEIQSHADQFCFNVLGPLVELYLNNTGVTYQRAFPQLDTMRAYYIKHNEVQFTIFIDEKRLKLIFEINAGSPKMEMELFSYGEVIELKPFQRYFDMMIKLIDAKVYYGAEEV